MLTTENASGLVAGSTAKDKAAPEDPAKFFIRALRNTRVCARSLVAGEVYPVGAEHHLPPADAEFLVRIAKAEWTDAPKRTTRKARSGHATLEGAGAEGATSDE